MTNIQNQMGNDLNVKKQIWEKIKDLKLDNSMKNYLLNCDSDGILTKQDADHLKNIGRYITVQMMEAVQN